MVRRCVVAALAALALTGCEATSEAAPAPGAESGSPLEGVWRVVEVQATDPVGTPETDPVSVYIFAGTHYSIMRVLGAQPRPRFADVTATDEERLVAWGNFIANSGTF